MLFFSTAAKKDANGTIEYLVKWKYGELTAVSSMEDKTKWPQLVLDYLEDCIVWTRDFKCVAFNFEDPIETEDPIGSPIVVTCE